MGHRVAVLKRRPAAAVRHAARAVPRAGQPVRRRVHRLAGDEPGRRAAARAASASAAATLDARRPRRSPPCVDADERRSPLGFRPEALPSATGHSAAHIRTVEDLGSEVFVHVAVDHHGETCRSCPRCRRRSTAARRHRSAADHRHGARVRRRRAAAGDRRRRRALNCARCPGRALVTGAAGDIGRATARSARPSAAGRSWRRRSPARGARTRGDRRDLCGRRARTSWPATFDVTDAAAVRMRSATWRGELGAPAAVFTNAGVQGDVRTRARPRRRRAPRRARRQRRRRVQHRAGDGPRDDRPAMAGSIVCTASMAGVTGAPNMPVYSASKAAVIGLARSAAKDLAPLGIRVNAVSPASSARPDVGQPGRPRPPRAASTTPTTRRRSPAR